MNATSLLDLMLTVPLKLDRFRTEWIGFGHGDNWGNPKLSPVSNVAQLVR